MDWAEKICRKPVWEGSPSKLLLYSGYFFWVVQCPAQQPLNYHWVALGSQSNVGIFIDTLHKTWLPTWLEPFWFFHKWPSSILVLCKFSFLKKGTNFSDLGNSAVSISPFKCQFLHPQSLRWPHEKGWLEDNFPFGMNLRGYVKFSGCIAGSLPARNRPEINNFPKNKNQRFIAHRQFAQSFFWDHLNLHQRWKSGRSKHPSKIEQTLKRYMSFIGNNN